ncbi:MAG: IscS subfamily cysteine desulfurase [Gammaproteobacteria bacterium]|nr:IscS subfamily cysteine desulfurase [Gammaproteobacteria bacterium]|tara:strand:- start:5850 stop:7022 length:1173 start_codon:yes stop_codon:yes gene_type:complete
MTEKDQEIYLDYASSTPLAKEVVAEMEAAMKNRSFGNPSTTEHLFGKQADDLIKNARLEVASIINAFPDEIIWTSGATEANNLAILGLSRFKSTDAKRQIISSFSEHKSVIDTCKKLESDGMELLLLSPNANGSIDINELEKAICDSTFLVSLMHINNEVGSINDIKLIGHICRKNNIFLHVDAAQGIGKLAVDVRDCNIDLMSLSAHKIYGPKGIGALFIDKESVGRIDPIFSGGGQERALRPGTLATHQIVGMARAYRIAKDNMSENYNHLRACRKVFLDNCKMLKGIQINSNSEQTFPGILSISAKGLHAESIIYDMRTIAVSRGSACTSDNDEPSHVLKAMGLAHDWINGTIRFSFGRDTSLEEVQFASKLYSNSVNRLNRLRGRK